MHLLQTTSGGQITFVIADAPAQYHDAIRGLAFSESADGFIKPVPTTPDTARAFDRFAHYLDTIVKQAAHEIPVPWERAFDSFLKRTSGIAADWWVTGSLAFALRGVPIEPGDIDLIVDGPGAVAWGAALADILIEPAAETSWFCKYWGRAFDHARIEWIGEVDPQSDFEYVQAFYLPAVDHLETVNWHGYAVRIPPVEPLLRMDEARGRLDRVAQVRAALGGG
jgi:hypothetical protein